MNTRTTAEPYTFAPEWHAERERLGSLEGLWDPSSWRALCKIGVSAGSSCLDVGAGGGSVSRMLADLVGPRGRVVALDSDTGFLERAELPEQVEIRTHDLLSDEPLSETFDLVHARMTLSHLPQREEVLDQLVQLCASGGRVLLSEFDAEGASLAEPGPARDDAERFQRVHDAVVAALARNGCDSRFAHRMPAELAARGLTEIDASPDGELVRGGSAAAEFYRHTFLRLREPILAHTPVDADTFDRVRERLKDPEFVVLSAPLVSVWGKRDESSDAVDRSARRRPGRSAG
ncbi:Methyltransferase domain-containing protein [Actinopolyspora saharensis]|uniref:Methyltransferase domain-containing protein n=1 Tax=Actinopolyspora saharensis TaxID=995062 RepID=A0A1H0ZCB0_9ACTN|nr:Methyltransferase domain-containing protein [Actinopolyspora saharensis]